MSGVVKSAVVAFRPTEFERVALEVAKDRLRQVHRDMRVIRLGDDESISDRQALGVIIGQWHTELLRVKVVVRKVNKKGTPKTVKDA
jgi:hypothetical protein